MAVVRQPRWAPDSTTLMRWKAANDPTYLRLVERTPTLRVRVPEPIGAWWLRSVAPWLKSYAPVISLGAFAWDALLTRPSPALSPLVDPSAGYEWAPKYNESLPPIPLYGGVRLPIRNVEILVPGRVQFEWEGETPNYLPQVGLEAIHRHGRLMDALRSLPTPKPLPQPSSVFTRRMPPRGPQEGNRRRQDNKVPGWYNRLLAFTNKTYGPVSEYLEILNAFTQNPYDLDAIATALSVGQAYDRAIGEQAQWTKRNIYDAGYWPLPVGYRTLSNLWRH